MKMVLRSRQLLMAAVLVLCFGLLSRPAAVLSAGGERVVVDSLGRRVACPEKVERIACMYAFTGHVVAMLGQADKIVAVSNGLKRDVLLNDLFPAIGRAVVPKVQGAVNIEELIGADPDIVFVQARTGSNPAFADKLDALGLTWLAVDVRSMAGQREVIAMIGEAIGASARATAYNDYYKDCVERIGRAMAKIPPGNRPRVYLSTVQPYRTAPGNSLPSDWMRSIGLINVASMDAAGPLNGNDMVGMEQILLWDPQVILANEPGVCDFIRKNPKWSQIAAVRADRLYQLPIGISRWGHPGSLETPLAILWTAGTLYPEKFRNIDLKAEIKWFYRYFFNYDVSKQTMDHILGGKGMRLEKHGNRKKHRER